MSQEIPEDDGAVVLPQPSSILDGAVVMVLSTAVESLDSWPRWRVGVGSGIARALENMYWRTCIQTVEGSVIGRVFLVEGGCCFFSQNSTACLLSYSLLTQ